MKIKAWLDSSANTYSKKEIELEFDDVDWNEMKDEQKEELVKEQVFQYLDWGYEEA